MHFSATKAAIGWFALTGLLASADINELAGDRLAVERVYYDKQIGPKPPFEQAMPHSVAERRVRLELLKEHLLKNVFGMEVTSAMVQTEVERIHRTTLAPEMLRQIHASLGNDPSRFARAIARPLVVDRLLRDRFHSDDRLQAHLRQRAELLRAQLLEAKPVERLSLLKARPDVRQVQWIFSPRSSNDLSIDSNVYFADLPREMQEVLNVQLREPGDVSAVFGSNENFAVYVAISRDVTVLTVSAIEIPRLTFDDWVMAQASTNP